jgi:small-conductance mechanosensitive channel
METGQWVDGDLYNGRIVLIANSYVLRSRYFNYSDFPFFLWDDKILIQYGSDYEKRNYSKAEELT